MPWFREEHWNRKIKSGQNFVKIDASHHSHKHTKAACTQCAHTCSIVFEVECVRTWNRTNVLVEQAKTHAHKNILTSLFADQAHPHDVSE